MFSTPLMIIFIKWFIEGELSQIWKDAKDHLQKKGEKDLANYYCPTSLIFTACKVMQSIIKEEIILSMINNNLNLQHGFVPGKSCQSNLFSMLEKLAD